MDAVRMRNGRWRPARRRRRDNCSRQQEAERDKNTGQRSKKLWPPPASDGSAGLASDLSRGRAGHVTHHPPRCRRKCAMARAARRHGEARRDGARIFDTSTVTATATATAAEPSPRRFSCLSSSTSWAPNSAPTFSPSSLARARRAHATRRLGLVFRLSHQFHSLSLCRRRQNAQAKTAGLASRRCSLEVTIRARCRLLCHT